MPAIRNTIGFNIWLTLTSSVPKREGHRGCTGSASLFAGGDGTFRARWNQQQARARGVHASNNLSSYALSRMQRSKPRYAGPMSMQPADRSSTMPAPMLPAMSLSNEPVRRQAALPKTKSRTDAVRAAKAKITRRNSLRKQRQAQKGVISHGPSVAGVVFPIQRPKVRKSMHRETVLVPFAVDI